MKPFTEEDRYIYNLSPDAVVIDAGAHKGDFTAEIVRRYDCKVFALEPIKRFYNILEERFRDVDNVQLMNVGLGAKQETVRMWVKGDSSGRFASGEEHEDVTLIKASHVIWPRIELLKLNIEGGEFDVLSHLIETNAIRRHKNIQVQFHSVITDAEKRYLEINTALLKTHHLTFDAGPWVWQNYRLNE